MKPLSLLVLASFVNLFIIVIVVSLGPKKTTSTVAVPVVTPAPTRQVIRKQVIVTVTPKPTAVVIQKSPTTIPTATPAQDNRCLVTVDGVKYDVTSFRQTHSGGNIFNCGSDMSQTFWGQHGAKILSQMAKYKI